MKYLDGQDVRLGDRVRADGDPTGLIVCCFDTGEYSPEFPKADWEYLRQGCLVSSSKYGLVHWLEADEDLKLIERKSDC
jgi:hypothetical protein